MDTEILTNPRNEQWTPGQRYRATFRIDTLKVLGYDLVPEWVKRMKINDALEHWQREHSSNARIVDKSYDPDNDRIELVVDATGHGSVILIPLGAFIAIALIYGITLVLLTTYTVISKGGSGVGTAIGAGVTTSLIVAAIIGFIVLKRGG